MLNWFSIRRYIILQLLRGGAFFLLALQYQRTIPELVGLLHIAGTVSVAMVLGREIGRRGVRRPFGALLVLGTPWALRLIVAGALNALAILGGEAFEALPLLFDGVFWPALPLFYPVLILTCVVERNEQAIVWEIASRALVLFALFWNQGDYSISLYPHPVYAALAVGAIILVEVAILFTYTHRGVRASRTFASAVVAGGSRGGSLHGSSGVSASRSAMRRLARESIALVPLILLVSLLFAVFLEQYSERATRAGGGLLQPSLFSFDFSDVLELESQISMSDELVLLFRRPGRPRYDLLRRSVLDSWSARSGFSRDDEALRRYASEGDRRSEVPGRSRELTTGEYFARELQEQELYIINFNPNALLALSEPSRVTPYRSWDNSSFERVYSVESEVSTARPVQLRRMERPGADDVPDGFLDHYTDFGGDERIGALAREVTDGIEGVFDKVDAIERYFHEEFYYSLSPGVAPDGNQLHYFLFDSHRGYCTYFAYAMALMLRSLDIPSRVAVGFIIDPGYEVLNFYTVRGDMAHAWVEVYFPDYGWIEFDPTTDRLHPDEEYERAPAPDPEEIAGLLEEIFAHRDGLSVEDSEGENSEGEVDGFAAVRRELRDALLRVASLWYGILPALYLVVMGAVRIAPLLMFGFSGEPRTKMAALYRHALVQCAAHGVVRERGDSRVQFAGACAAAGLDIEALTSEYLKSVFARDYRESDLALGIEAWRQFRYGSLPGYGNRKLLALLDPRVLRVRL